MDITRPQQAPPLPNSFHEKKNLGNESGPTPTKTMKKLHLNPIDLKVTSASIFVSLQQKRHQLVIPTLSPTQEQIIFTSTPLLFLVHV